MASRNQIKWAGGEALIQAHQGWEIKARYNSRGERAALRVEALLRSIPGSENRGGRTDFWYWWGAPMPPDMPERIDAAAMSSARRSR